MKKLKTALIVILAIVATSVLIYFLPTDGIAGSIPFLNKLYRNTTLEIITINGKAKVSIDGKEYGETPLTINDLTPGEYSIELEKISDSETFYNKQSFNITLTRNTTSRIELEIGPSGILHGAILYYTKQNNLDKNNGQLSVLCDISESKVYLDGEYIKKVPVIAHILRAKEYELEVIADNYDPLSIPILLEDGYLLNVKTYLFPIPITFDETVNE
jgi:hypothetical protein